MCVYVCVCDYFIILGLGQTVKLSYRFKKRAVHQSCLLPRSMSAGMYYHYSLKRYSSHLSCCWYL